MVLSAPPLVITMGEPAGIGPALIARLFRDREALGLAPFYVTGTTSAILAHDTDLPIETITAPSACNEVFAKALPVLSVADNTATTPGVLNPFTAPATIAAIDRAVGAVLDGTARAIVTAPIHKAHLASAGFPAPGHTEYLALKAGLKASDSVMMLANDSLRVVPVTGHIALKDVPSALTLDKIVHTGLVLHHDLKNHFHISKPRIAVAGLNPHAGEGGLLGMEEATHIQPAIWALRDDYGVDVSDPLPPDTLFHTEARGQYDAVLCMYHDQALIPIKTLDFWSSVNVTLGLPFVRTSPDHGTALDRAAQATVRPDSFLAALRLADQLTRHGDA